MSARLPALFRVVATRVPGYLKRCTVARSAIEMSLSDSDSIRVDRTSARLGWWVVATYSSSSFLLPPPFLLNLAVFLLPVTLPPAARQIIINKRDFGYLANYFISNKYVIARYATKYITQHVVAYMCWLSGKNLNLYNRKRC